MGILEKLAKSMDPAPGSPAGPISYQRKRQRILAGKAAAEAESQQAQADAARGVLNTIPEVGSTLGSLAGPLGAGIGAGLGQTAVEVGRAGVGEGFDSGAIAKRAAGAAAGQYGGNLIGKGIGKIGGVVTGSLRRKAVEKAADEYAKAAQAGVTEPTLALTQGVPKMLQRAGRAGQREVDHMLDEFRNFMSNKPPELTPIELHEIRQVMDEIAQPFYDKVGKLKAPPDPAIAAKVRFAKQVADNARESLRRLVPSATKFEAQASRAIRARKFVPIGSAGSLGGLAARTAIAGSLGGLAGGVPGGTSASLAMLLMSQPQIAMGLGKILESQAVPALAGQAGRVVGDALNRR